MQSLSAASYTSVPDRGAAKQLEKVREELNRVINGKFSSPARRDTDIEPCPRSSAPRSERRISMRCLTTLTMPKGRHGRAGQMIVSWSFLVREPAEIIVYLLALTAVKTLGRNPVGSETLLETDHLDIILFHTSVPRQPLPSPPSREPPLPTSPPALEALRILANLLVLHPGGRKAFARAGGAISVAKALAGKNWEGILEVEVELPDRLFLLARVGFLVTVERTEAVEIMVEREDVVDSLAYVSILVLSVAYA